MTTEARLDDGSNDPETISEISSMREEDAAIDETGFDANEERKSKSVVHIVDYIETDENAEKKEPIIYDAEPLKGKPPKPEREPDRIFLFEIILDSLSLSYCTEFMNRCYKGPNFIMYKFLGRGPFKLYENKPVMRECLNTKIGASHLFSISPKEIEYACKKFRLYLVAKRDAPDSIITLGKGYMDLTALMKSINTRERAAAMKQSILAETAKKENRIPECEPDTFSEIMHTQIVLNERKCDKAVLLECYIRLTCFGRMMKRPYCIVTPKVSEEFPEYVNCSNNCTPR